MGRLRVRTLIWFAFVMLTMVGTAMSLAVLTWLIRRPELFWPRLSSYWLSRHSAPFWVTAAGLSLVGGLLVPGVAWPPGPRELQAVPADTALAGLAYALLRFARHAWEGIPFWGQIKAFWPEVLVLSLSLAAGSLLSLLALRWVMLVRTVRPALSGVSRRPPGSAITPLPVRAHRPAPGGNPASPGEPRDARSVRRGRIRGHRPGDNRHGSRSRRYP